MLFLFLIKMNRLRMFNEALVAFAPLGHLTNRDFQKAFLLYLNTYILAGDTF